MTVPMRRWGRKRMLRHLSTLHQALEPVHPACAMFCNGCEAELDEVVYAGWRGGLTIYPFLCADCAADWVNLGGRIVLRWVR